MLQRIEAHVEWCLHSDTASELERFDESPAVHPLVRTAPQGPQPPDFSALDARFEQLKGQADVRAALDPARENELMPRLLSAGLTAWIRESGDARKEFWLDSSPGIQPDLHAKLRRRLDVETEDENHWAFRAIAATNLRTALGQLEKACRATGVTPGMLRHRLFILRNPGWAKGAKTKTQQVLADLRKAGGDSLPVTEADLRCFDALGVMLTEESPDLNAWLAARRPVGRTELFSTVFAGVASPPPATSASALPEPATLPQEAPRGPTGSQPKEGDTASPAVAPHLPRTAEDSEPTITVGFVLNTKAPVRLRLESLRRHTVIYAGSGSGKTVLIRRLVEECALRGVSAIVLDPNNDLARLGDPWPETPTQWTRDDAARAAEYLEATEVLIWTPGRSSGRPLNFQPLPDLRSLQRDPDELDLAISGAIDALAPRAKVDSNSSKANLGRAVLSEALRYLTGLGNHGLDALIDLLTGLPVEASRLDQASRLAAEMAEQLKASSVTDPLFGGGGEHADPGMLLTPATQHQGL